VPLNSGVIGCALIYGLFASVAVCRVRARYTETGGTAKVIFGALVYYLFIALSAIMHYNILLAAYFAPSAPLLGSCAKRARSGSNHE
jgi:hypothetical protein